MAPPTTSSRCRGKTATACLTRPTASRVPGDQEPTVRTSVVSSAGPSVVPPTRTTRFSSRTDTWSARGNERRGPGTNRRSGVVDLGRRQRLAVGAEAAGDEHPTVGEERRAVVRAGNAQGAGVGEAAGRRVVHLRGR